jgi:hypothetical protein
MTASTRAAARALTSTAALAISVGCAGGAPSVAGLGEPIVIETAVFKAGPLPGTPPPSPDAGAGAGADTDAGAPAGPAVTAVQLPSGLGFAGQAGKSLSGLTSPDAVAVAVKLASAGSGYWLQPVGFPDPTAGGDLTFDMIADFAASVPTGLQALRFVAIDAAGAAGPQTDVALCIDGVIPDNFNACNPKIAPPAAVISLAWDSAADLDLQVVTPAGQVVDPKHPGAPAAGAEGGAAAAPAAVFTTDAGANCSAAGARRESLVWQKPPAPGTYLLRVNLFAACGAAAAHFVLTVATAAPTGADTSALVEGQRLVGELLASQANGGAGPGLYVGAVNF